MSIEVGNKVTGKVSGITNFGAFIDLGDRKTGLVHISEVSDSFIKDIKDVLKIGEEVTVKVMSIGDDGKIGLSIRRAVDKPVEPASSPQEKTGGYQGRRESAAPRSGGYQSQRGNARGMKSVEPKKDDFDSLMSSFLKDSDDRLTILKRSTEGKRGGRGGRRN
ncbi:S1 RNA binding domain protein [Carnobacterium iners]|uniref:S1 RNA binding domain protein n=1 Tax=Carnobacterium iners TaxID=1073423 RepID=A0A1X7MT62_9LACT|nr:S1 domain-containing RNA-binding protein [Carnobacterium iners]MCA9764937.1 RNA-binding protein S1 [Carnobacterium sp.]SEK98095.1 S1 RNA binding domain protein [Carnobacterium iners]SMH27226.1 S1 RNA binding domain protein [Carnobacterium iners]